MSAVSCGFEPWTPPHGRPERIARDQDAAGLVEHRDGARACAPASR